MDPLIDAQDKEKVREWLNTSEALILVEQISRAVCRDILRQAEYFRPLFPNLHSPEDRKELTDILKSELTLFLLEKLPIIRSGNPNISRYLRQSFMNEMRSRLRSPEVNRFSYLYKRVSDLFRESSRFKISVEKKGAFLGREEKAAKIQPLSVEDLDSIPFPDAFTGTRTFDSINRKKVLSVLADHFLNGLSEMFHTESIRVSVRDFVSWIALHIPLNVPKQESAHPNGSDPLETLADKETKDGRCFDPAQIAIWAEKCANTLNDRERSVFYLRFGTSKTLEEIAEAAGLKSASNVHYTLESAVEKLKLFLIDLPVKDMRVAS